jgi:small ligand-binding sensory domain FIST
MPLFLLGHATHPDWRMALALASAQLDAQLDAHRNQRKARQQPPVQPTLGWLYFSDHYAPQAEALLADVQARYPGMAVVGGVGVGLMAGEVEYLDEPALALMVTDLPRSQFRIFSGRAPLQPEPAFAPWTALVQADPATPELDELIAELAERTSAHYLFGGLASARTRTVLVADGVYEGGLVGVAFDEHVALASRVTQGCLPVGPARTISSAHRNVVEALDGQQALPLLLADLGIAAHGPSLPAHRLASTLVGLTERQHRAVQLGGQFGADTLVRPLVGVDPARQAIAIGDEAQVGTQLTFCRRDVDAARRDLVRICTELREEAETGGLRAPLPPEHPPAPARVPVPGRPPEATRIAGALYISCTGRGGPHFGAPSAEVQIVRRALGEVPLIGFFAAGEVARSHLYGYTGVLTVFLNPA